ncbi:MAG: holo-[acyl-carrier-protein] synthase [Minwuia thermotolerans]|nr:MAG: holo-[acyl-carrier-protein] synthase [Minwuia thermotolerans]
MSVILGIGTDLCYVERIRHSLDRLGNAWIDRLFSACERELCIAAADPALSFAQSFCGKEACAKALGTGLTQGVEWLDIEVLPYALAPKLQLRNDALNTLMQMVPADHGAELHVTCSSNGLLAQSMVLLSAAPNT